MSTEVVTCSKVITLHNLDSRQPISSYTHHRGIINCTSVNHTNKVIASCGQDGKIFLVTPDKPETKLLEKNFYPNIKEKPSSLSSCAFSPNSRYIAVGSVDSLVKIWDLRGDKNSEKDQGFMQIKSHMCGVTSLAWIKNYRNSDVVSSDVLASSSSSGEIYLHTNKTGSFQEVMALKLQEGINCIKVSEAHDYSRLAACTNGGTLAVWDLLSGKDKPFWTTNSSENKATMTSLSFGTYSPMLLVTASVDETLTFFDIQEKKVVKKIIAEQPLSCVGLHSNGHTLVAGGMYGNCFVYDLRSPSKPINKLNGHETTIKSLQFFKTKESSTNDKSRPPTIANVNSSSSIPSSVEKSIVVDKSASNVEIRSKQNMKAPQIKTNNFVNMNIKPPVESFSKQKKVEQKLSQTSQDIMKNQNIKTELMSETGSQYFRRNRQSKTEVADLGARTDPKEITQMKGKIISLEKEVKTLHNDMFEMEERLNLSMIRQFQLHQNQMTSLLQSFLSRQKQKDEKIKQLQAQNLRLKSTTF